MSDRINTEPDDETWYSKCLPILEAVREVERTDESFLLQIGWLADRTGLDPNDVVLEVERLIEDGYLSGRLGGPLSGGDVRPWHVANARLAPDGARAVGLWPRDPYEALLTVLDRRIAEAPDDDTRSKLRKVRDRFVALGSDVGTNLFASVLFELIRGAR